jgi:DNA invertase Pin-like site-specific DNA recombinase
MAVYGYARVSTGEQDLTIQRDALTKAGCTIIREEKRSGTSREGREELATLLAFLRPGDTLMVTRIDRLARSNQDFQNIYADLTARGVKLKCTEQPIMDTDGALGGLMVNILAAFAEFETRLRRERQLEGIAKAKEAGVYAGKGRPRKIDRDEIARLKAEGVSPTEIARKLSINRTTVYRLTEEASA